MIIKQKPLKPTKERNSENEPGRKREKTAMGVRGTVSGALKGGYLLVKHKKRTYHINPHDAYPVINLSGTVTFDGWTMGPNGKLKIKKG